MVEVEKCLEQIVRTVDILRSALEEIEREGRLSEDMKRLLKDSYDALVSYCARR